MRPMITFYRGKKVNVIFTLPNPKIVDVNVGEKNKERHIKGIDKAELLVRLIDAEAMANALEDIHNKALELIEYIQSKQQR